MTKAVTTDDGYFGGCPECGHSGQMVNVGRDHYGICPVHKVRWWIGSNLFSGWRHETEETWEANAKRLEGYRDVQPIYPEPTEKERQQRAEHEELMRRADAVDQGHGVYFFMGIPLPLGPNDNPFGW